MDHLRPIAREDLPMVLAWRNQPSVRQAMFTQRPITPEAHAAWFERLQTDETRRAWLFCSDDTPLGLVSLIAIDPLQGSASWGFYSADPARPGIGSRMALLALERAFGTLGRIEAEVLASNPRSLAFHHKLGFTAVRVAAGAHDAGNGPCDVHHLALERADWPSARARLLQRLASWPPAEPASALPAPGPARASLPSDPNEAPRP